MNWSDTESDSLSFLNIVSITIIYKLKKTLVVFCCCCCFHFWRLAAMSALHFVFEGSSRHHAIDGTEKKTSDSGFLNSSNYVLCHRIYQGMKPTTTTLSILQSSTRIKTRSFMEKHLFLFLEEFVNFSQFRNRRDCGVTENLTQTLPLIFISMKKWRGESNCW